jgi:hypothetical protein
MKNLYAEPSQQKSVAEMKLRLRALVVQYQDVETAQMLDEIKEKRTMTEQPTTKRNQGRAPRSRCVVPGTSDRSEHG